jgi:hypothetical protein
MKRKSGGKMVSLRLEKSTVDYIKRVAKLAETTPTVIINVLLALDLCARNQHDKG